MNAPLDIPSGVRLSDYTRHFGTSFSSKTTAILGVLAFPRSVPDNQQVQTVSDLLPDLGQDLMSWPVCAPHSGLSIYVVGGQESYDPQAVYVVFGKSRLMESAQAAKAWMRWKHKEKMIDFLSWHILRDLTAPSDRKYLLLRSRVLSRKGQFSVTG